MGRTNSHTPDLPYLEIAKGKVEGHFLVHKFGAGLLNTTLESITQDKTYPTPTAAVSLEVVSDNAADNSAGIGAREVIIAGLDSNWDAVTEIVSMNGITPVALTTPMLRVYRWAVSPVDGSGSYATETVGSHQGTLTLRVAGAGATWSTLTTTPFPVGQSQIGVYTIPNGYTAFLLSKNIFVDTAKAADIYFFQRPYANTVVAPFSAMRLFQREVGVTGGFDLDSFSPKGPLVGPCDVGFMGSISVGTAECSVEFELVVIENKYIDLD